MLLKLVELRSSDWGRVRAAAAASNATPDNDPNYFMVGIYSTILFVFFWRVNIYAVFYCFLFRMNLHSIQKTAHLLQLQTQVCPVTKQMQHLNLANANCVRLIPYRICREIPRDPGQAGLFRWLFRRKWRWIVSRLKKIGVIWWLSFTALPALQGVAGVCCSTLIHTPLKLLIKFN